MLHLFRRQGKWKKWILSAVILTLGAGMLLLFVNSPTGAAGVGIGDIASCAGEPITAIEFRRSYRQLLNLYRQQFGDENFERLLPNLQIGDQALNRLITDCAVAYEAKRLGLSATREEIQDRVMAEPIFKDPSGRFVGTTAYQQILQANNWSPASFEENLRKLILRDKLEGMLTNGIEPGLIQLREQFAKQNQEFRVRYTYFDPNQLSEDSIGESELRDFFEEHSLSYQLPEKRQAEYLMLPIDREAVQLSEEQITDRMEAIPEVERVRASHILFKIEPGGEDTEAREKAEGALKRIRAGEDFAALARELSEDTSAPDGGDLGFFTRGEMVPEFSDVAFAQEAGEISEPVTSPFGVHIIQTTSKPRTREESRRLLAESQLREEAAARIVKARSTDIVNELREGTPLEELAQREGLQTGKTELLSQQDQVLKLGVNLNFTQQLFAVQEGEYLEPYAGLTQFIIARAVALEPAKMPAFEDVRAEVLENFKEGQGEERAREQAQDFFKTALKVGSLEQVADERELPLASTSFFKTGSTIDDILQFSPILHERVIFMEPGEVSPPINVGGKRIVFELLEKTEFDEAAFQEQKEQLALGLRQQERSNVFLGYIQNVVDRLREEQGIAVDSELLDSITGSL